LDCANTHVSCGCAIWTRGRLENGGAKEARSGCLAFAIVSPLSSLLLRNRYLKEINAPQRHPKTGSSLRLIRKPRPMVLWLQRLRKKRFLQSHPIFGLGRLVDTIEKIWGRYLLDCGSGAGLARERAKELAKAKMEVWKRILIDVGDQLRRRYMCSWNSCFSV